MFPGSWFVDVTVIRGGGRDPRTGDPLPAEEVTVDRCLIGSRASSEPADRSDLVDGTAVLYRMVHDFEFLSTDRVRVDGPWMPGSYVVDGAPSHWPAGWEVPLRRGT